MSHVVNCPTCNAKCKTKTDKQTGETIYSALQDEDLGNKIKQLKEQIQKLRKQIKDQDAS
ncbi:MAG: hypothetical protein PVI90_11165 [Desulfobacteraceae bacterium]|jgi:hypothetical protein